MKSLGNGVPAQPTSNFASRQKPDPIAGLSGCVAVPQRLPRAHAAARHGGASRRERVLAGNETRHDRFTSAIVTPHGVGLRNTWLVT